MFPGTYAVTSPDQPAIIIANTGEIVTYRQLDKHSADIASALREIGLRPGDVVALLTDNRPGAFDIYWAAMCSGLYITGRWQQRIRLPPTQRSVWSAGAQTSQQT
jgi:fatty-acyl-CoA synthase